MKVRFTSVGDELLLPLFFTSQKVYIRGWYTQNKKWVKIDITNKKTLVCPLKVVIFTIFLDVSNTLSGYNPYFFVVISVFTDKKWLFLPLLVLSVFLTLPVCAQSYFRAKNTMRTIYRKVSRELPKLLNLRMNF
jgi:hypothetical protein